jgi:hypothetical protein
MVKASFIEADKRQHQDLGNELINGTPTRGSAVFGFGVGPRLGRLLNDDCRKL